MANLEFEELNAQELREVNGGIWKEVAFFIAGAIFTWGFSAGQEDRNKQQ